MRHLFSLIGAIAALLAAFPSVAAPFSPTEAARVDAIAAEVLASTGAPSASIAIVRDGQIAYARAYGSAALAPARPATPGDRYPIGSISKQFTAMAILLLVQDGRLSLDDTVAGYLPDLTAADRISLRQLLSHTSGYQSYFTLDVTPAEGRRPIAPAAIAGRWGKAPLDFEPGARWAYSNTGYTVAGLMVETVSGQTLTDVLRARVFTPLGMTSATDARLGGLKARDAEGYTRYALGPTRLAQPIGDGWLFAAGGLAMTASDLARWNIGVIDRAVLTPAGYEAQQTDTPLADGSASGYGLGVYVGEARGRRRLSHDGSIDGFGAENRIYPADRAAIVVLVNADFGAAQYVLADRLEAMLFPMADPPAPPAPAVGARPTPAPDPAGAQELAMAQTLYAQVRSGRLERDRLTADVDDYFSDAVLSDYRDSLSPLGDPPSFVQVRRDVIGGLKASLYELTWPDRKLIAILRLTPEGRVASFVVFPA